MFKEHRPLWVEVNLDNLASNIRNIRKLLKPGTEYISVVKADAYGHGAVEVAKICMECGIKWMAVAMLDEALELRSAGIKGGVLILGYTPAIMADTIVKNDISQTCYSYELAKALSDAGVRLGRMAKIHIAVDTGMGRIGFQPSEEDALIVKRISELPNLKIEGIFTHFAVADEKDKVYTHEQFGKYNRFLSMLDSMKVDVGLKHVGNSAEIVDLPDFNLDAVRPGIIQYGLYPSEEVMKSKIDLKPVMSVKANVIHVKEVEKGTSISYGRKYITTARSKIVTLPIGYADGYTRMLFGKAKVIINGKYAPVVGAICMDQCMVDATSVGDVKVGDEVVIMGSDGNLTISAEDIASSIGTINYEVVCMFSKRVPRVYIKDGKVYRVKNYLLDNLY